MYAAISTASPARPSRGGSRIARVADCLFCKIIERQIPASIVYEDDRVLAFNDINPQAPTHVLVVPKRHIASLDELSQGDDEIVGEVVRRAAAIAKERGITAGVSHPPASSRRPESALAARIIKSGFKIVGGLR